MKLDALQLKSPVPELAAFQLTRLNLRSRWNRKNFPDLAHMAFNLQLLTPLKRLNQRNRRSFLQLDLYDQFGGHKFLSGKS